MMPGFVALAAGLLLAPVPLSPAQAGAVDKAAPASQDRRPELFLLTKQVQKAVDRVEPSVVTIETFGGYLGGKKEAAGPPREMPDPRRPSPRRRNPRSSLRPRHFLQGQGASTGLVLSRDGWILTSSFILNFNPTTIIVTLPDGRKLTALRKGEDRTRGLALLKVKAENLPIPEFLGKDELRVGQWAFALGRSFGPKRPTVHAGIVSALGRINGKAVQCDAYTSPANYGGPLIDIQGRVMGVVCPLSPRGEAAGANMYDSGIGFAASLEGLSEIIEGMKQGRIYKKALLGVQIDPSHLGPGARIRSARKKSAASQAGLSKGDVVLEVEGRKIRNPLHLQYVIGAYYAGDFLRLLYRERNSGTEVEALVQLDGQEG